MDQELLVREQIDAGLRFLNELDKSLPVKTAFWVKASEDERWYLYVASDKVTDSNIGRCYGDVLRVTRDEAARFPLSPFQIDPIRSG
jgi:hypothetical protein